MGQGDFAQNGKEKGSLWTLIGGWALIVVGIAGTILPVIPGLPMVVAGLALLASHYPWARRAMTWVKALPKRWRAWRARAKETHERV